MVHEKADIVTPVRLCYTQSSFVVGQLAAAGAPRSPMLTVIILDSMCLEQRPTSSLGNSLLRGLSVWCSMMSDIPASAYTTSVAISPPKKK